VSVSDPSIVIGNKTESLITDNILEVGEVWSYGATYTTTASDMSSSSTVIASTITSSCSEISAQKTASVSTPITKTTNLVMSILPTGSVSKLGEVVTYKASLSNTGNIDLTNVKVNSTHAQLTLQSGDNVPLGIMNAGETWVYSGTYKTSPVDFAPFGNINLANNITASCDQVAAKSQTISTLLAYPCAVYTIPSLFGIPMKDGNGIDLYLVDNQALNNPTSPVNPTSAQVFNFLVTDKTDLIPYSGTFDTSDAAMTIHNNAEAAGLRCAFVSVTFSNSAKSYACNEFVVSDMKTPLYVDCVNLTTKITGGADTYVNLEIGQSYVRKDIYNTATVYPMDTSYGNVTNITPIWHA
jgi:hypothetical protein